jgi:hypothetical protein
MPANISVLVDTKSALSPLIAGREEVCRRQLTPSLDSYKTIPTRFVPNDFSSLTLVHFKFLAQPTAVAMDALLANQGSHRG